MMESISGLSDSEEIVLSVLQILSAALSLMGSSAIVYKILRHLEKTKTTTPYDRIMLCLSCCDILASITYAMGPLLLPRETSQRVWAVGTDWTCSRLGFLTQLTCLWAVWYNALLSFYFLLTVRFRVGPDKFRGKYEPWMHLSGAIFFPVTAMIGLAGDWYSEERLTMMCWIGEVPKGVGGYGLLVASLFGGIPTAITLLSLVINNIAIYLFVRKSLLHRAASTATSKTTTMTKEEDPETATTTTRGSEIGVEEHNDSTPSNKRASVKSAKVRSLEERLTREVAIQGLLYVSSFILTVTPGFILSLLEGVGFTEGDQGRLYQLLVLNSMLLPLQGLFNVLIYIKPSYSRFRSRYPKKSMVFVLKQALFNQDIPRLSSVMAVSSGRVMRSSLRSSLAVIIEEVSVDDSVSSTPEPVDSESSSASRT